MKILNKLRKYFENNEANISMNELFLYAPEFKAHLLLYRPEVFMSNQEYVNELIG